MFFKFNEEIHLSINKDNSNSNSSESTCNYSSEIRDDCLIIFLSGDITSNCEEKVLKEYEKVKEKKLQFMIMDFKNVHYINSAGIAVFINLLTMTRQNEQKLYLSNLSEYFLKIFTIIGLIRYSKHFSHLAEALEYVKGEQKS